MLPGNVSPRNIQAEEIRRLREENQKLKEEKEKVEKLAENRLKAIRQVGSTSLSSHMFEWGIAAGVFLTFAVIGTIWKVAGFHQEL